MNSEEIKAEAVRLARLGESYYAIGEKLGVTHQSVGNWARSAGIVRGKGGGCVADANQARLEEACRRIEAKIGCDYEIVELRPGNHATLRCRACGSVFDRKVDTRYPTTCFNCQRIASDKNREKKREENAKRALMQRLVNILAHEHVCPECGRSFRSGNPHQTYCSDSCRNRARWRRRSRKRGNHSTHVARAKRYGVEYDRSITLDRLIKRDGMTCYICGKSCDKNDKRWGTFGPDYPTIDHVVPLSKGGTHTWGNVRIACGMCNEKKGDAIE